MKAEPPEVEAAFESCQDMHLRAKFFFPYTQMLQANALQNGVGNRTILLKHFYLHDGPVLRLHIPLHSLPRSQPFFLLLHRAYRLRHQPSWLRTHPDPLHYLRWNRNFLIWRWSLVWTGQTNKQTYKKKKSAKENKDQKSNVLISQMLFKYFHKAKASLVTKHTCCPCGGVWEHNFVSIWC